MTCVVLRDMFGYQHAERVGEGESALKAAKRFAEQFPFDPGEEISYGTTLVDDPGLARLLPNMEIDWWGSFLAQSPGQRNR